MRRLPRYPVYVISKGRASSAFTARLFSRHGVPFHLVVEPQEFDEYAARYPGATMQKLPFSNLGQGSIPARNWVWEHARAAGHRRHWILDDNIPSIYRHYDGLKIKCAPHVAMAVVEDFADRYENVAIAGMNYEMFALNGRKMRPVVRNVHVYSNLLILNELPYRWRGRYNEDTDLCLQVLSGGWCTVLVNAFLIKKIATMRMKGGNTDVLYRGDGRLQMARSLERQWPYVVATKRRFGRPQHVVRRTWAQFDQPLIRRADVDFDSLATSDEYGLELRQVKPEIGSPGVEKLFEATS